MHRKLVLPVVAVALLLTTPTAGTAAEAADASIARELAELNRSLRSIADVLERLDRKQNVTLLLRRIEIKERKILPRESALRGSRSTLESMTTDLGQIESYLEQAREQIAATIREGAVGPDAEHRLDALRREETEATRMIEAREREIEQHEQRQLELEDELEDLRDEIEDLEALLDALTEPDDR